MDMLLDDILHVIFERIDSVVSLVRAASTCKRWCRIIGRPGFFHSFRSVHTRRAFLAGYYFNDSALLSSLRRAPRISNCTISSSSEAKQTRDRPSFVPASSVDAGKFSMDFLPSNGFPLPHSWIVLDSRGSLLLVRRAPLGQLPYGFSDMFICEPATRRYKTIPRPTKPFQGLGKDFDGSYRAAFLVDGEGCRISMSNFKVVCLLHTFLASRSTVFTARDGASWSWTNVAPKIVLGNIDPPARLLELGLKKEQFDPLSHARALGRAAGSWNFHVPGNLGHHLIILDGRTGEFSDSSFSFSSRNSVGFDYHNSNYYVADGHDGEPRIVAVFDEALKVFRRHQNGDWELEKSIMLPEATRGILGYNPSFFENPMKILIMGPGFVVLGPQAIERWLVSIDLESWEVKLLDLEDDMWGIIAHGCEFPWPRALSARV